MADALALGLLVMMAAVAMIGGSYAAFCVRRWSRRQDSPGAFTLQELREMLARQEIDDQEFQALRGQILHNSANEQHSSGTSGSTGA